VAETRFKRYELKYPIRPDEIERVRAMIAPYARPDDYASWRPGYTYTVRSIYYDTPGLRFYWEKDAGLRVRKKLRLRTYNEDGPDSVVSFEIKRKNGTIIFKERVILPLGVGQAYLHEGRRAMDGLRPSPGARATLERFAQLTELLRLRPVVLISYDREAYIGRINGRERLTIDKDIRSLARPRADEWHAERGFRHLTDHIQVLELKFDGSMPPWMRPVTGYLDRTHRPISKYCKGIDLWGQGSF